MVKWSLGPCFFPGTDHVQELGECLRLRSVVVDERCVLLGWVSGVHHAVDYGGKLLVES